MARMLVAKDQIARGCLSGEYGSAEQRAAVLLLAHLTRWQRRSYLYTGSFAVKGSKGRRYRLTHWHHKPVKWLPLWPLPFFVRGCVRSLGLDVVEEWPHPVYPGIPIGDRLLALKLLAETDQDRFHETANW